MVQNTGDESLNFLRKSDEDPWAFLYISVRECQVLELQWNKPRGKNSLHSCVLMDCRSNKTQIFCWVCPKMRNYDSWFITLKNIGLEEVLYFHVFAKCDNLAMSKHEAGRVSGIAAWSTSTVRPRPNHLVTPTFLRDSFYGMSWRDLEILKAENWRLVDGWDLTSICKYCRMLPPCFFENENNSLV